jgi:hypothetical protein
MEVSWTFTRWKRTESVRQQPFHMVHDRSLKYKSTSDYAYSSFSSFSLPAPPRSMSPRLREMGVLSGLDFPRGPPLDRSELETCSDMSDG